MKKAIILLSTITISFIGCNNSEKKTDEDINKVNISEEINVQEEVIIEKEHHHAEEVIVLNDGEKWKIDENMLTFIRNMDAGINDFET